ncbi:retron St85 family RNA-directed DNA polymerase [Pseudoxanthomonas sp. PXM02]|uniref:retron St85 family RNA-directed DNA polymerase n=1 Tax=Pseudoxanthomonas sp. PXM02 TaxID=2769294 RepID=UPI001782112A|nr:retron St85 family RNA-directed DNA polymerase [Pseudoxanthomonas sp. PXM02]MBD9480576.1 RNA-directed DNA polymerase [Pseudoxanthomonas sp. PXM02]
MNGDLLSFVVAQTGLSRQAVIRISETARHRYKVFSIDKKRGGKRIVAQPAREVKAVQRAIVAALSSRLPVHESATAYVPGSKLINNAIPHAGQKYLLKFDFENFFPSIDDSAIRKALSGETQNGFSQDDILLVVGSCLWRPPGSSLLGLCIGAPSSPFLSNAVMFEFDGIVSRLARELGISYTRFSDDVTFSGPDASSLSKMELGFRETCRELNAPKLVVNEKKRTFCSRGAAMRVTGLTLSNGGGVTVGRARKRGVRAGVDNYLRGTLDLKKVERLRGEVAFVISIEPLFRDVLIATFGDRVRDVLPS